MEKIWLRHYSPGIPTEIDFGQNRSIGELFESNTRKYRDRPAYTNMGRTLSFGDLDRLSRDFGAWLQVKGLAKGARVAVMMPNCLQYPVCVFGILRTGGVVVNVNPLYTPRELEHQLKDSGAEAIVVLENFAHVLQRVIAKTSVKHVIVASLGDLLGAKGAAVNFVVRHVKKMVPSWKSPARSVSTPRSARESSAS
jgi:long-chain acyl-CoA synthetase